MSVLGPGVTIYHCVHVERQTHSMLSVCSATFGKLFALMLDVVSVDVDGDAGGYGHP